jgi:hypothetical protein
MKVFISWSGERSGQIADALRDWLPYIFEKVEPWLSRTDIDAGARWGRGIEEQLEATRFGIICLTAENAGAPWVNFEAGAIAKVVAESSVVPYCFDIAPAGIPRGPLTLFQGVTADVDGTWALVQAMHSASNDARSEDRVRKVFDMWWPKLEIELSAVSKSAEPRVPKRQSEEMLSEILEIVRGLERRSAGGAMAELVSLADATNVPCADGVNLLAGGFGRSLGGLWNVRGRQRNLFFEKAQTQAEMFRMLDEIEQDAIQTAAVAQRVRKNLAPGETDESRGETEHVSRSANSKPKDD